MSPPPASISAPPAPARVVLLDRDGTLVIDRDYLADPAGLQFLPGAIEGLRRLHAMGHRLVIISNQSGVGRGLFSLEQLNAVNERLAQLLRAAGVTLAGIYCCPHRPEEACACRKPNVGLVRRAALELAFDPSEAVMIGDRDSDIELGRRLGATTIRLAGARRCMDADQAPTRHPIGVPADHLAADLLQAARIIETLPPLPRAAGLQPPLRNP